MKQCQSCGLPLHKDPSGMGGGTEKDGSISLLYCSYCYKDGSFVGKDCTVQEMQAIVDKALKEQKWNRLMRKMAVWQIPHLQRWKKK